MNEQVISGSGRKKQEVYGTVSTTIDTTGLATTAKQDTQTTELTSIKTAVETIDNAIAGTEMQVDVVAPLPAGTNNIGDVDVFSNTVKDGSGTRYQPLVDADGHFQVDVLTMPAGGAGLTDTELRATPVPVSGTVTANLAAGTNNIGDVDVLTINGVAPAFGTGARGATVQRVTIATDDSVPVTGTFWQATQPVSGTVDLGATDNAVLDAIAASTAAIDADTSTIIGHVDGIETLIGTTNTTLTTIDGRVDGLEASNSAIQTSVELMDDTVTAQGTALGTTKTILNGASVTTAAPTYTTGQISPLNLATTGALRVDVGATSANATAIKVNVASGGIASGGIASGAIASGAIASGAIASGAIAAGAIAAGATSIATTEDTASAAADHLVKVAQIRLDTPVSGANVSTSGDYTQFIADSFGKTWTAGTYAEDLAHVAGEPIMGSGARRIDTLANSAGTSGDWATVNQTAEGALWATLTPTTNSGWTIFRTLDADETEEEIKASAGTLGGWFIYNDGTAEVYVKFYNATAASVSVGTTTPILTIPIPAGGASNIEFTNGISFATALCIAATTGVADADTAAPAANQVIANVFYK